MVMGARRSTVFANAILSFVRALTPWLSQQGKTPGSTNVMHLKQRAGDSSIQWEQSQPCVGVHDSRMCKCWQLKCKQKDRPALGFGCTAGIGRRC
jgi:hypothetical protein